MVTILARKFRNRNSVARFTRGIVNVKCIFASLTTKNNEIREIFARLAASNLWAVPMPRGYFDEAGGYVGAVPAAIADGESAASIRCYLRTPIALHSLWFQNFFRLPKGVEMLVPRKISSKKSIPEDDICCRMPTWPPW